MCELPASPHQRVIAAAPWFRDMIAKAGLTISKDTGYHLSYLI
jgi:hypothetical protein